MGMTMRLFVAIELTDAVRRRLGTLQSQHRDLDSVVRWVRPEQIHLTLKFLGAVPDAKAAEIVDALTAVAPNHAPFEFAVRGAGCFPARGAPRVFWVGVEEPTGALERLQAACEEAMAAIGFPPEGRRYSPHLTLARVKGARGGGAVRDAAQSAAGFDGGAQRVGEVVLFESRLSPQGARHTPVGRAKLGATE
jgi:2'-5' RNA ligase